MNQGRGKPAAEAVSDPVHAGPDVLFHLYSRVLDQIGTYLLTGEFQHFQPRLEELKQQLLASEFEEAGSFEEGTRAILAGYSRQSRESFQNAATEMQQIVGVLGQALTALSGGSERSLSTLQKIHESLHKTSMIQDVTSLRSSLSEAIQLIRKESVREHQVAARERESFETEVTRIQGLFAGNPNRRLPGRQEGIRAISDSLSSLSPGRVLCVIAFVFDQLKAVVQRYGPEGVDDLFLLLIRERLQPVAPSNTAYRWTPSSLVGVFQCEPDIARLKSEMAALNRAPLVCRIALGGRTAVLKMGISHLIVEGAAGGGDTLVSELDRFTGALEAAAV